MHIVNETIWAAVVRPRIMSHDRPKQDGSEYKVKKGEQGKKRVFLRLQHCDNGMRMVRVSRCVRYASLLRHGTALP
ncbi:hypothetical protein SERLADRAFT_458366 [Serpula lacrymans var. lacrymans S7.9]|uniref:Uncharacterized protein n=1 Tax=Serpula lacrymans var. lacrymans (strain S7.9) TaxID=578457 RepID=F8NIP6_SERL9|nr:uncharacterized protein SERLADRAFT_458366 [Serpula lacrymans var. lacrymans S7.9]EGO29961.1 hypothetical protein SERLADRAFT_458366 [Serpula lacrymans var. lacrymans S7.9]